MSIKQFNDAGTFGTTLSAQPTANRTIILPDASGTLALTTDSLQQIGVVQTWQDVTASRVSGTTYTNSTEKPIMVSISGQSTSGASHNITVNGILIIVGGGGAMLRPSSQVIVPTGSTYSVSITNTAGLIWAELR